MATIPNPEYYHNFNSAYSNFMVVTNQIPHRLDIDIKYRYKYSIIFLNM